MYGGIDDLYVYITTQNTPVYIYIYIYIYIYLVHLATHGAYKGWLEQWRYMCDRKRQSIDLYCTKILELRTFQDLRTHDQK